MKVGFGAILQTHRSRRIGRSAPKLAVAIAANGCPDSDPLPPFVSVNGDDGPCPRPWKNALEGSGRRAVFPGVTVEIPVD